MSWVGKTTNSKQYVLGFDIGGTKVGAELFEVIGGKISEKAIWNTNPAS